MIPAHLPALWDERGAVGVPRAASSHGAIRDALGRREDGHLEPGHVDTVARRYHGPVALLSDADRARCAGGRTSFLFRAPRRGRWRIPGIGAVTSTASLVRPELVVRPEHIIDVISQESRIPKDMIYRDTSDRFSAMEADLGRRPAGQRETGVYPPGGRRPRASRCRRPRKPTARADN